MAGLSPGPGQKHPPTGSLPGEEEPSARAELKIFVMPVDDPPTAHAVHETRGVGVDPPGRLKALIRRLGLRVDMKMSVPCKDAGDMLALFRSVGHELTWALTAVITLAILVPAGTSASVLITVMVLELAGFTASGLLSRRRTR